MDVTEIERLWILGLEDKKGGDEITLVKDDTPEEDVSMEWMEEQEEEDSESCTTERKKKHRNLTLCVQGVILEEEAEKAGGAYETSVICTLSRLAGVFNTSKKLT